MTTVYFSCTWGEKPTATFSRKPVGKEIGVVKWRSEPITVKILSTTPFTIKKEKVYPKDLYALLKSNLQKQMRRKSPYTVATASKMWDMGKFEFLRRLVVISSEDAELSVETGVVTWLMVAVSKGMALDENHKRWVMGYVKSLLSVDSCPWLKIKGKREDYDGNIGPMDIIDHVQSSVLLPILFRCAYGGLSGDPPMISKCIDYHLRSKKPLRHLTVEPCNINTQLLINRAAIDHHIWPSLIDEIEAEYPEYTSELIARVIWECSSSLNKTY